MYLRKIKFAIPLFACIAFTCVGCSDRNSKQSAEHAPIADSVSSSDVEVWLTKSDQSALLQKQPLIQFADTVNDLPVIDIDSSTSYQVIEGFGYTLTGGSAFLINRLGAAQKQALINELFGNGEKSIGISYLRISIGASDLNASVFSYDDKPAGTTDKDLSGFSLSQDTVDLIPLLKLILALNPHIKIMGSPWSAPAWMKDNGKSMGGSLRPQFYDTYAKYFVKYIQAMQAEGINIDAITIQNEPQHGGNNPSMVMSAIQQANFVKNNLGPAFQAAGIRTKIIIWDHNCDNPEYPITVLNDSASKKYIDGTAFHLYNGDVSALSEVHDAHPDKNLYFTEQWTGAKGTFEGDLKWHIKNVIIGTTRNWSRNALEWNLANDAAFQPHTPGGCTECKGALTVSGSSLTRNVAYYIIAHASKFIPAGSARIFSSLPENLPNVAFRTPTGKKVIIILNEGSSAVDFNLRYKGRLARTSLPAGTVATYIW